MLSHPNKPPDQPTRRILDRGIAAGIEGVRTLRENDAAMSSVPLSRLARLCWAVDARRWLLSVLNVVAATGSVVGCVGFYWPEWYAPSVTLFLFGSISF
jgi:hypothetical protein